LQISALLPAVSDTKESGSSKWGKWIDLVPAPSKATRHHSGWSMQSHDKADGEEPVTKKRCRKALEPRPRTPFDDEFSMDEDELKESEQQRSEELRRRPSAVDVCDKRFSRIDNFIMHQRILANERP